MNRLLLGGLLSCMIVGQTLSFVDLFDCIQEKKVDIKRQIVEKKYVDLKESSDFGYGVSDAGIQLLGSGILGAFVALVRSECNFSRNIRLAVGISALGSLCKGAVMCQAGTKPRADYDFRNRMRDYYGYDTYRQEDWCVSVIGMDGIADNGLGRVSVGALALASLAVTARRPAFLAMRWQQLRNQFSQPSSRLQGLE